MKRIFAIIPLIMVLLVSCMTIVDAPVPEEPHVEEKADGIPGAGATAMSEQEWNRVFGKSIKEIGGLSVLYEGKRMEIVVITGVSSYDDAVFLTPEGFSLPDTDELDAVRTQLVDKGLLEISYCWTNEVSQFFVKVMNMETGYVGNFYPDVDFVSALYVKR